MPGMIEGQRLVGISKSLSHGLGIDALPKFNGQRFQVPGATSGAVEIGRHVLQLATDDAGIASEQTRDLSN